MKHVLLVATVLSLAVSPALSQSLPGLFTPRVPVAPGVVLPAGAAVPVGVAANFALFAPILGGVLVFSALAAGATGSTTSTVSTTN